jgi:hypothetical protein
MDQWKNSILVKILIKTQNEKTLPTYAFSICISAI